MHSFKNTIDANALMFELQLVEHLHRSHVLRKSARFICLVMFTWLIPNQPQRALTLVACPGIAPAPLTVYSSLL